MGEIDSISCEMISKEKLQTSYLRQRHNAYFFHSTRFDNPAPITQLGHIFSLFNVQRNILYHLQNSPNSRQKFSPELNFGVSPISSFSFVFLKLRIVWSPDHYEGSQIQPILVEHADPRRSHLCSVFLFTNKGILSFLLHA